MLRNIKAQNIWLNFLETNKIKYLINNEKITTLHEKFAAGKFHIFANRKIKILWKIAFAGNRKF